MLFEDQSNPLQKTHDNAAKSKRATVSNMTINFILFEKPLPFSDDHSGDHSDDVGRVTRDIMVMIHECICG